MLKKNYAAFLIIIVILSGCAYLNNSSNNDANDQNVQTSPSKYFSTTAISSEGSSMTSTKFYFADINGDGSADKIYWNPDVNGGQINIFLSQSNGTFSTTGTLSSGSGRPDTKFYFAKVNNDAYADKIIWHYDSENGNLRVYPGQSNGTFSTTALLNSGSSKEDSNFYFVDINQDGIDDKIYWNYDVADGNIRVYYGNSNGYFNTFYTSYSGSSKSDTRFYFADVNGDTYIDKIYWNYDANGGEMRVFPGESVNYAFSSTYIENTGSTLYATKFFFIDENHDGIDDKIYWNPNVDSGNIKVYSGSSTGEFSVYYTSYSGSTSDITTFYFADVDNDSDLDEIYWNPEYHNGDLRVFLNLQ